jgi:hypothetical protein
LHKVAREVLGEEKEWKGIKRKQLYIDTDLDKLISEKKTLYQKCIAIKSKEDRNEYNLLKRKVMVK